MTRPVPLPEALSKRLKALSMQAGALANVAANVGRGACNLRISHGESDRAYIGRLLNAYLGAIEDFQKALSDAVDADLAVCSDDMDEIASAIIARAEENEQHLPDLTSEHRLTSADYGLRRAVHV